MKFSVSDLKNINYKQLLINHAEKFIFAFFVLCTINFLLGTPWKPYNNTPKNLSNIVLESEEIFKVSEWPDEDRKKFNNDENIIEEVKKVFDPFDASNYISNSGLFEPLMKVSKKFEDPVLLPAEKLMASVEKGPIYAKDPNKPKTNPNDKTESTSNEEKLNDEDDEGINFTPRSEAGGGKKVNIKKIKRPEGKKPKISFGGGSKDDGRRRFSKSKGNKRKRRQRSKKKPSDSYAKGYHYVIIKALIPHKKQLSKFAESKGELIYEETESGIYYDSVVERQEILPTSNKWPTEWEVLNTTSYRKVYSESEGELDTIVSDLYTHPFLTMPLPAKAMGRWGSNINHPSLKESQLTPLQEKIIDAVNELQDEGTLGQEEEVKEETLPEKQWDNGDQSSLKSLAGEINNSNDKLKILLAKIKEEEEFKDVSENEIKEMVKAKAEAEGSQLLFRFFDFDVIPGRKYRYRIQLVLKNPHYGLSPSILAHPDVADGLKRFTPWSQISEPVVIADDSNYFLSNIDPERGSNSAKADFEYYQWLKDSGTMIYQQLSVQPGQFVGALVNTRVLRPGPDTYKNEDIDLDNHDIVVDLTPAPSFSRKDHSDLKTNHDRRKQTGLYSEALIANEFGALVSLDPNTISKATRKTKKEYEMQMKAYKNIIETLIEDEILDKEEAEEKKRLEKENRRGGKKNSDRGSR